MYKRQLFALEVPEIADGTVEIAALAREAGHRTKIAVHATAPGINAKGACIGPMGARVRAVMAELRGEKIDIVDYSDDPAEFVAAALSPARVSAVQVVDPKLRAARVIVPDYQLSPVSYTHLDVYKRQHQHRPTRRHPPGNSRGGLRTRCAARHRCHPATGSPSAGPGASRRSSPSIRCDGPVRVGPHAVASRPWHRFCLLYTSRCV